MWPQWTLEEPKKDVPLFPPSTRTDSKRSAWIVWSSTSVLTGMILVVVVAVVFANLRSPPPDLPHYHVAMIGNSMM